MQWVREKMHEFFVMQSVVETVLVEAGKRPAARVISVLLEVGELTMLGDEQMRFAFASLTDSTIAKGALLVLEHTPAAIRCRSAACGYNGPVDHTTLPQTHRLLPLLACPRCGGPVDIIQGLGCVLRAVKLVMDDEATDVQCE